MTERLIVISPVRNEATHFERVARAMAAQTRPPDVWAVVDDGSTDETPALLDRLAAEIPFLVPLRAPQAEDSATVRDRHAVAAAPRTFNSGLSQLEGESFTHVSKLDGDMELPPRYYEELLERFRRDPALGIAGGRYTEEVRGQAQLERIPESYHVSGALKCYTRYCFEAIGGMQQRLGWDSIDETYARMHGYRTRTFNELVGVHHRAWGSADGVLRGRARYGMTAYIVQFPLWWVALRAFKIGASPPLGLSGIAFLYGYLRAALRRTGRVDDPAYRRFLRRELRGRIRERLPRRRSQRGAELLGTR